MAYIKGTPREQQQMLPSYVEDYVSEDNPVRVIDAFVESLDLKQLGFRHTDPTAVGHPSYDPKDKLKLYLYGYMNRIRSSRRLETETQRNLELKWLLKNVTPDFKTIADFRRDHKKELDKVFREFNRFAETLGLIGKQIIAIDGTKIKASNSRKNNYNARKLDQKIKRLDEKIDEYLKELDENDEREADTPRKSAEEIKDIVRKLRERKLTFQETKQRMKDTGQTEISTTDPDARMMSNNNNTVDISYNIQTAVDAKHKLIIDYKVINQPNDQGQLAVMGRRVKKILGKTFTLLADKGYYQAADLKKCARQGLTTYITKQTFATKTGDPDFFPNKFRYNPARGTYTCPAGQELFPGRSRSHQGKITGRDYRHMRACNMCSVRERCTTSKRGRTIMRGIDQDFLDQIDRKTKENQPIYQTRQMIVEHPYGTIKAEWGAYYFLTRGLRAVSAEMALVFTAYNIRRVINIVGVRKILEILQTQTHQPELG